MDKVYLLVAGINGAGKTSLYNVCQDLRSGRRVNSDEICHDNGWDWRNPANSFRAGKIAAKLLDEAFKNGEPICQETTLTGHGILNHIRKAKERGYRIEMHYVGVESVAIAKARVARRVSLGGHGIPDADIERRYAQSMANVREVAAIVDDLYFYDNSRDIAGLARVARYANGRLLNEGKDLPAWYVAIKNDILQKSAAMDKKGPEKSPADRAMGKLFPGKANDAKKEKTSVKANDKPHGMSR